ncbi:glycosyltransferase family 9 protein [Candidatus Woesearchaeota archaeon]|nr:glycosyltransferase family 9 protein [Candidatus Woesearchaeota archaeon]
MQASTVKLLDKALGIPTCAALALARPFRRKPEKVERILAICFWGIGSVVNTLPVLKALKRKYPKARLDVLTPTKNAALFYKNKHVNQLILIDMNVFSLLKVMRRVRGKYDLVIDMEHWLNISAIIAFLASGRVAGFSNKFRSVLYSDKIPFNPEQHAVLNNMELARLAGAYYPIEKLEKIETAANDKKFVQRLLKQHGINERKQLVIGICPGSGGTIVERRWPKEKFAELADRLAGKHKAHVVFVGAPDEQTLIQEVQGLMQHGSLNAAGITLSQSIALIDSCHVFISNDTGPMHIAAAQGIKTIGLFGPETPVIFGPYGKFNIALYKGEGPTIRIYEGVHEKPKENVLDKITVDEVFRAAEKQIRRLRGR